MNHQDYPVLTDLAPDTLPASPDGQPAETSPDGVVLELIERGHRLALALPVFSWPCTVGRAASADLVLTDPSIAAQHVRLHHDGAGRFEVEVLDPTNGVWLGRRHYQQGDRFAWAPGQRLTLGRGVQLNLRSSAQPLVATQRWRPFSRGQGIVMVLALLALAVLSTWITWLNATEAGEMARRLPPMMLWVFGGLLLWTLGWSLMSKLFTGTTAFWRHVCIASVGMVVLTVVDQLLTITGFALSLPLLTRFSSITTIAMLTVVFWFHLRAATQVSGRALGLAMAALLVLVVGTKLGLQWQSQKRLGDSLYMSTILPPQWRLAPTVSIERFMQDSDSMRQQLETRSQLEKEDDEADDSDDSALD